MLEKMKVIYAIKLLILFSRNAEDSCENPRLVQTDNLRLPQQHQP